MDAWVVPLLAGLYGLLIGSFLNVCSLRWPVDESVVRPRSRCPGCGNPIAWFDNVPVLSWLVLRGRCRACGAGVSLQYPLAELATGLMWAGVFALHGPSWEALRGSVFLSLVFGIAMADARFFIIPDQFSVGGTVLGVALAFLPGGIDWLPSLAGAALGYGVLWVVGVAGTWMIRRMSPGRLEGAGVDQAMGGGDVKMMMMVGAFLGAWGVALTVFLGSVLALGGALARAVAPGQEEEGALQKLIPFGVFLAAAGGVAYVWGDRLVGWYLTSVVGL